MIKNNEELRPVSLTLPYEMHVDSGARWTIANPGRKFVSWVTEVVMQLASGDLPVLETPWNTNCN
jgi:hypothetical protein